MLDVETCSDLTRTERETCDAVPRCTSILSLRGSQIHTLLYAGTGIAMVNAWSFDAMNSSLQTLWVSFDMIHRFSSPCWIPLLRLWLVVVFL